VDLYDWIEMLCSWLALVLVLVLVLVLDLLLA
jgi:hypothetical protein